MIQRFYLYLVGLLHNAIPQTVSCPWYRRILLRVAFSTHLTMPKLSLWCWRMSRKWALERTHVAMAAYSTGLMMGMADDTECNHKWIGGVDAAFMACTVCGELRDGFGV